MPIERYENTVGGSRRDAVSVDQAVLDERDARIFEVLQIDMDEFKKKTFSAQDLSLQCFMESAVERTPNHQDVATFKSADGSFISCVNWKGKHFISGTDIVRCLLTRYEYFVQRPPFHTKKFEEGVFSDLRRLTPPKDCVLEPTRSEFLVFLFNYDCVRSKKKQKVFYWKSFMNCFTTMFCDAIDRELARREMARAVGLSIDDFIKSGIVPTGTNSNTDTTDLSIPGVFDWSVHALENVRGLPSTSKHVMTMDQIHIIRNDIAKLFNQKLRIPLSQQSTDKIPPEMKLEIDEILKNNVGKGVINQVKLQESLGECNSGNEDEDGVIIKTKRAPRPKKVPSPSVPKSSERATKKQRLVEEGIISVANHQTTPVSDDNFSASTLSSDDESFFTTGYVHPSYSYWRCRPNTSPSLIKPRSVKVLTLPFQSQIKAANERKARFLNGDITEENDPLPSESMESMLNFASDGCTGASPSLSKMRLSSDSDFSSVASPDIKGNGLESSLMFTEAAQILYKLAKDK